MFITKKDFLAYQRQMEVSYDRILFRYWELQWAHDRLLQHLGLHESTIKEHKVLRSKGGPEASES